ncbi:MAG TPA: MG2 domain-containing protein, partial [Flavisolibacter sp.]
MRSFFLVLVFALVALSLHAQPVSYDRSWRKVDQLVKQNLPKSALAEVKKIYAAAKAGKNDPQLIRALVYMTELQSETREDNLPASIREIENEILAAREPAASILRSMLADMYWQYFQSNRYRLYSRTNTVNFVKEDIATWTSEDLHRKISELYLASLRNDAILKQTNIAAFDAIIRKGNVRHLRPTLFDLLAHRALVYFSNSERDIRKPAYAFEISSATAFAPAADFARASFATRDSLSLHHKALLTYQQLLRFHLNDRDPAALLDADLLRLQFVYDNSTHPEKDSLFVNALEYVSDKYRTHPGVKQARYLLAAYYFERANSLLHPGDTTNSRNYIIARRILEPVVADSTVKNEGWVNAYNLLGHILASWLSFQVEKVNVPDQPFRVLLKYRNLGHVHLRVVRADEQLKKQLEDRTDDNRYWNVLVKAPVLRSWEQAIPVIGDHREHSVELKVDGLQPGSYYLLVSDDRQPNGGSRVAAASFHVSAISYVSQGMKYFVLHRETGQPLAGASVTLYSRVYDYRKGTYSREAVGNYTTDNRGYFEARPASDTRRDAYNVDIRYKDDRLNNEEFEYGYYYDNSRQPVVQNRIFFFTDRSIYRPGQRVHFKGIAIAAGGKKNSILPAFATKVYLRDVNYQLRDSMNVTTNEFGSFSGMFMLPQNLLNGNFTITTKDGHGSAGFSVEEYKRPKFYVEFEKVKEEYRVGDSVRLTGVATAYAANAIGGAKVVYRIVRQPRFLYPWIFRGGWIPQGEPMEIAHGEVITDAGGRFQLAFQAIPDKSISRNMDPVFDYHVYADVTDLNGETRSGKTVVSAAYKSLLIKTTVDESLPVDSLKKIFIRTENMNGEFRRADVTVTLTRLQPEDRLIRKRYWPQPDTFVMSREQFLQHFPHDEYRDETNPANWTRGEQAYRRTDSTRLDGSWNIDVSFQPGHYELKVVTTDKDGKPVTDIRYVELFDPKQARPTDPLYLITRHARSVQPGETATVQVGTAAKEVFLVQQTQKRINERDSFSLAFHALNNEIRSFSVQVTEDDRGIIGMNFFFVKHNRIYSVTETVTVPWLNKELDISFETFRDKTLPGSNETWKVRIAGYKGEKVAAEMLASMYDASLDQFRPHQWSEPAVWNQSFMPRPWQGQSNFVAAESQARWLQVPSRHFEKEYDELKLSVMQHVYPEAGYGRGGAYSERLQGKAVGVQANGAPSPPSMDMAAQKRSAPSSATEEGDASTAMDTTSEEIPQPVPQVQVRRNFNETAFFFPDLKTDADGAITFSFVVPEALTRWKLQALAHTKELAFGLSS